MTNPQKQLEPEDNRRAEWRDHRELCNLLAGDSVLIPFKDGEPDWEGTNRDTITKVAHWSDLEQEDIPRLAVLTDSFQRFIGRGEDVSVITLWRDGTPIVNQIDGEPCARALDIVMEAIADDVTLDDAAGLPITGPKPTSDSNWGPVDEAMARLSDSLSFPKAANDNKPYADEITERLLRLQREHGGKIAGRSLFGATIDKQSGRIEIGTDGVAVLHTLRGSFHVTETTRIAATAFSLGDPTALPEREWLFGRHYIRKYATASVGPGGGGKTAHSISETLAIVTGRPLLDPDGPMTKPLRVWWINAEDPQDEIGRRFHGAAKHFGVTNEQVGGRLFTDSGRDQQFVIARQEGRDIKIVEPFIDDMVSEIRRRQIDIVIIDPFVSTHEAQENDNGAMQRVTAAWVRVADEANCAVELVHHVAKNQGEVTADSARGGGAFKDKVRSMRVFNVMTQAEAEKAGIDDARSYFRVDFGKVNMVASGRSQWRRFKSVPLMNGTGLIKTGDEIGVVEPWSWPSQDDLAERAASARAAVIADVPVDLLVGLKARLTGSDYKASEQATNWAGKLVAELFGMDVKADRKRIKEMLAAWIDAGELEIVDLPDVYRHMKPHVKPTAAL